MFEIQKVLPVLVSISFCLVGVIAEDLSEFQIRQICNGKYMEIISYPSEPGSFILCLNENTKVGKCRLENTVQTCFDERKKACSLDSCPRQTSSSSSDYDTFIINHCKDDGNLFQRMPAEACDSFYICMGSQTDAVREFCPDGQHYSKMAQTCMSPMEANCQTLESMCATKNAGYRFGSKTCYDYYECENSKPIAKSCPFGEHFDNLTKKCIPERNSQCIDQVNRTPKCTMDTNGQYFKHRQCNRFYMCLKTVALEGQCPQNYYFDSSAQHCRRDTKGICEE